MKHTFIKWFLALAIIGVCIATSVAQDKKISQLAPLPSVNGSTELIPLAKSGTNYYTTPLQLLSYFAANTPLNNGLIWIGNSSNLPQGQLPTLSATPGTFSLSNTGVWTFPNASGSTRGLLSASDWSHFNNDFIPVAGTNTAYPLTGPIEFNGGAGAFKYGIWSDVSSTNPWAIGATNNKTSSSATVGSTLYFDSQATNENGFTLSSFSNGYGYQKFYGSADAGYSLMQSYINSGSVDGSIKVDAGGGQSIVSRMAIGSTETDITQTPYDLQIYANHSGFLGLNYTSSTAALVTTNQTQYSLLHRAAGDARWLSSSYSVAPTSVTTTGTSGASTLSGNVLNIPRYDNATSLPSLTTATALASIGTVTAGVWNGTTIGTSYLPASQSQLTTATNLTSVGTLTTGTWNAGIIPLSYGGTNANLTASNGGILWSNASQVQILAGTGTANKLLLSGSSATPAWSTPTFPNSSPGAGTFLRGDGTNWTTSTLTIPNTLSLGSIPYAGSANTLTENNSRFTFNPSGNGLVVTNTAGGTSPTIFSTCNTTSANNTFGSFYAQVNNTSTSAIMTQMFLTSGPSSGVAAAGHGQMIKFGMINHAQTAYLVTSKLTTNWTTCATNDNRSKISLWASNNTDANTDVSVEVLSCSPSGVVIGTQSATTVSTAKLDIIGTGTTTAKAIRGLQSDGTTESFSITDAGNLTLKSGIVGTTTNDNAATGNIGEIVNSKVAVGSAVTFTTATAMNITSISLTAGDWLVSGNVNFSETTATVTSRTASIGTTSATLSTDGTEVENGAQSTLLTEKNSCTVPTKRVSISGTTTVYLVGSCTFSAGTAVGYGNITAVRIR